MFTSTIKNNVTIIGAGLVGGEILYKKPKTSSNPFPREIKISSLISPTGRIHM
jgi:hypothetical protein